MAKTSPPTIPTLAAYNARGIELAELCRRYPADEWAREQLADYCLHRIKVITRGLVFGTGRYPKSCGPDAFYEECVSLASEKYTKGIGTLEDPNSLHAWLKRMVRCVLIDVYRKMSGRDAGSDDRGFVPLHRTEGEGKEKEEFMVLDDPKPRAAALAHLPASIGVMSEGEKWLEALANGELLMKVLEKHAEDNPDSAICVKQIWDGLDAQRIAKKRRCTERTVYRMLEHDNSEMIRLGREMVMIEAPDTADLGKR